MGTVGAYGPGLELSKAKGCLYVQFRIILGPGFGHAFVHDREICFAIIDLFEQFLVREDPDFFHMDGVADLSGQVADSDKVWGVGGDGHCLVSQVNLVAQWLVRATLNQDKPGSIQGYGEGKGRPQAVQDG